MEHLIDKAALVAEIEKRRDESWLGIYTKEKGIIFDITDEILSFLDTLEVKEVKEPTAADKGVAEEIIVNLRRIEQDYLIDLTKEMEWVRSKVQKGE